MAQQRAQAFDRRVSLFPGSQHALNLVAARCRSSHSALHVGRATYLGARR